jgi:hypothetical protein
MLLTDTMAMSEENIPKNVKNRNSAWLILGILNVEANVTCVAALSTALILVWKKCS